MPTLTEKMQRYRLAVAAGDAAAARRIANEPIAPPAPRHAPRVAQVTYPAWGQAGQADYERMATELEALRAKTRLLQGQLKQHAQRSYDAERRLAQLEGAGE